MQISEYHIATTQQFSNRYWLYLANSRKLKSSKSKNSKYHISKKFVNTNGGLYCYAGNNPVGYTDPDGQFAHIAIAAGIGAAISATGAWISGASGREILAAAVGGAVSGGLAAATCGASLVTTVVGSALASTAGYCAEQMIAGKSGSVQGMAYAAVGGATGAMVGEIAGQAISTVTEAINKVPDLKNGDYVYRVYGGEASADGASWTTTNPKTIKNYRNKAGLPDCNSGTNMITGVVNDSSKCVQSRKALPLDGNKGGLNEYIIPDPYKSNAIKIINTEILNPSL